MSKFVTLLGLFLAAILGFFGLATMATFQTEGAAISGPVGTFFSFLPDWWMVIVIGIFVMAAATSAYLFLKG